MRFDTLFHFSHGPLHLIETRRMDLPESAGPGDIYQWSFVDDGTVHLLGFVSMALNPQRRVFKEGSVEFTLNNCKGEIFGRNIDLNRQDTLSEKLKLALEVALKSKEKVPS